MTVAKQSTSIQDPLLTFSKVHPLIKPSRMSSKPLHHCTDATWGGAISNPAKHAQCSLLHLGCICLTTWKQGLSSGQNTQTEREDRFRGIFLNSRLWSQQRPLVRIKCPKPCNNDNLRGEYFRRDQIPIQTLCTQLGTQIQQEEDCNFVTES